MNGQDASLLSLADRIVAPKRAASVNARRLGQEAAADLAPAASNAAVRALLGFFAEHSPYLLRLARMDAERLSRILGQAPEAALQRILQTMTTVCADARSLGEAQHGLRAAKQEIALLAALADLGGVWSLDEITDALTRYADAALSAALSHLLREAARAGRMRLPDLAHPESDCGMSVIAMGKLGSRELNYSSDIDIIVVFDPDTGALAPGVEPAPLFVHLTQSLARLLQERTGDGYALRVDLRLRPDPGSTAVAISTPAAYAYYEMLGQNWERAALIKARPAAGDRRIGAALLDTLSPFIWRKYFDYAAIADIHAMKRQIHALRGYVEIAVAGRDVKLGRGGIREIEFFVQTQQLIFGGRRPMLRGARTTDMLRALASDGWIDSTAARELTEAYVFLRTVEHRLQMIDDEQTQRLPNDADALRRFAKFCGAKSLPDFSGKLLRHVRRVEFHYARLFEHAPGLGANGGDLVFTGIDDDPGTLATLKSMGFLDPARAADTVRGWHFGRRPAVQSARAREVLTELAPSLLTSFSESGDPDAALASFDAALARMPAAVELFSILKSNDIVRDLFADILGGAPRLAAEVVARPHVLDAAIDPALLHAGSTQDACLERARHLSTSTQNLEDILDAVRDFAHEESFLIGIRALSGAMDVGDLGKAFTHLADCILRIALEQVERRFALEHGVVAGGRCVILGMGRLGSREMTAASDLDLILLYDFAEDSCLSDGEKPLQAQQYYARLTQRLVSALTVGTRRGRLYEVDMRLRPSGRLGPLATQFSSFMAYQRDLAETWEHMSLCRARVVAGDRELATRVQSAITEILTRERDAELVRAEASAMRALVAAEKGDSDGWNLKLADGGLLDLEFLAQTTILIHARNFPALLSAQTAEVLAQAGAAGVIAPATAHRLIEAHRLFSATMQMIRLTTEGRFNPRTAAAGVSRRIVAAANAPDLRTLEAELSRARAAVKAAFVEILGARAPH